MESNVEFVTLEDNKECIILDKFTIGQDSYVILVNSLNKDDFYIRKIVNNNLIGLKDEEQFQNIFIEYLKLKANSEQMDGKNE